MPFLEEPAHLSKSRLKSDLVAHNVELPAAGSRKEIYVDLHLRHIDQTNAADFSSDDDDQMHDVATLDPPDARKPDPSALTDKDLRAVLLKYGVKAGPIVASTRAVYENKLRKLLLSNGKEELNKVEKTVLYSDSDEDEENEEKEEGEEGKKSEEEQKNPAKAVKLKQEQRNEKNVHVKRGDVTYSQCFFLSSRLRPCPPRNNERSSKRNPRNEIKSSERTAAQCSQIPAGISKVSSVAQHSGLRSGALQVPYGSQSVVSNEGSSLSSQAFSIAQLVKEMENRSSPSPCSDKELSHRSKPEHWSCSSRLDREIEDKDLIVDHAVYYTPIDCACVKKIKEPVKDILKEIFPDTKTSPTGIYATPRRPIKGAALRPIQYDYPSTPLSPTTLERKEEEKRLVPIYFQILVFLTLLLVLYFIFVNVEDSSNVVALLESVNQWAEGEEGIPVLDEPSSEL